MKKFTAMTLAAAMLATTAFGMNVSAAKSLKEFLDNEE
jgi:Phr family secreted Rap phosphatase inhibitor